ncbi:hypothetical protein DAERI_070057 [Deinococcus aerius]|uniref:Uncharacterized protein n=1 Tax=Deinococcus aerius TaxID=200253 RepID=A0A2I9CVR9_9DEIO|nr:hypothetical protein [Deinococcus aerius]GBF06059.1 hypothetical protein DAERI_070057 [Deinococcus aerius]
MTKKLLCTLALALTAAALAHQGHDHAATFTLAGKDTAFTLAGPASVAPGYTAFAFSNTTGQPFTPVLARLKGNVSDADVKAALGKLMASQGEDMGAIEKIAEFAGGSGGVMPGGTFEFGTTLTPGRYVVFGFGASEDGKPLYDLGQYRSFNVTGTASGATAPRADVKATLQDYKVVLPATVKAGKQVWQVSNAGQETHHLMLMRIKDGKTMKDVEAFFQAPDPSQAGEPPFEDAGGLETISGGRSAFVSFDLAPGEYVVACFLPSAKEHMPHFMLGMMTGLSVQ